VHAVVESAPAGVHAALEAKLQETEAAFAAAQQALSVAMQALYVGAARVPRGLPGVTSPSRRAAAGSAGGARGGGSGRGGADVIHRLAVAAGELTAARVPVQIGEAAGCG
jgi:hypothetical protein